MPGIFSRLWALRSNNFSMNLPKSGIQKDLSLPRAPKAGLSSPLEGKRLRLYIMQMALDGLILLGCSAALR
jgi:hypothetical protein